MNEQEIRDGLLRILGELAPEADLSQIKPDVRLRDQLDIDSMDFLNFLIAVDEELHVDIPEADYPRLATLDACVAYIRDKLGTQV
jgi:acyl carrier protein